MTQSLDQRLSPHFTLREMVVTSHRTIDNTPSIEIVKRLTHLCVVLLEPVRAWFGPLIVSSGFRCDELNRKIRGSRSSAHKFGCAADFAPLPSRGHTTAEVVQWIIESDLPFDQVIDEYSSTANWIHLGQTKPNRTSPRRQALTMRRGKYSPFERSAPCARNLRPVGSTVPSL